MSLSESDWEWAERICLIALKNNDAKVKTAALSAIGNIARRFHVLHLDVVLPAISKLREDANCKGIADDALDDIAIFVTSGDRLA
jgi:CO dehydrogenase/acetyl-CoA synthase epsilon subunit